MYDIYQVAEARAWGADAILIIMAATTDAQAQELYAAATELHMDALFEVHDQDEMQRALALAPKLVGINNRNLRSFETSLDTTRALMKMVPDDILLVSESGIASASDVQGLMQDGIPAFLVGESLMRQDDVTQATIKLIESL
jgi:indole-3-glycerol phosphate synthase